MKITIVGMGYVGLSLAALLSVDHKVLALETDTVKVNKIKNLEDTRIFSCDLTQFMSEEILS